MRQVVAANSQRSTKDKKPLQLLYFTYNHGRKKSGKSCKTLPRYKKVFTYNTV